MGPWIVVIKQSGRCVDHTRASFSFRSRYFHQFSFLFSSLEELLLIVFFFFFSQVSLMYSTCINYFKKKMLLGYGKSFMLCSWHLLLFYSREPKQINTLATLTSRSKRIISREEAPLFFKGMLICNSWDISSIFSLTFNLYLKVYR